MNNQTFSNNSGLNSDINFQLSHCQNKIIYQINKTHSLIHKQLIFLLLLGFQMVIFLTPFLFINQSPRNIAIGLIISINFFNPVYLQYIRKAKLYYESQSYLKKINYSSKTQNHTNFIQDISQYLEKLYDLLFYDRKRNTVSCAFLESKECPHQEEFESKIKKSLKNELKIIMTK